MGLFALLAFGTVHALLITPIWTRLLGGAPFALVAGIALACAFEELHRSRGWQTVRDGARFGGVMFGALLPATAFDTALRLIGADRNGWLTTAADFALALLAGAAAGWILTRSRRATLACGTAAIALSCATAGPLPLAQSARGAQLALAIAPICLAAGATLAPLRRQLTRRETR